MLEKKLLKELTAYCELNGLDLKRYINKLLKSAFALDKYGDRPFSNVEEKPKSKQMRAKAKETVKVESDDMVEIENTREKKVTIVVTEKNHEPDSNYNDISKKTEVIQTSNRRRKL